MSQSPGGDPPEEKRLTKKEANNKNLKFDDVDTHPCLKEHKLSLKCLDDNNHQKDKCEAFFLNYKACKGFWVSVKQDRRRRGIHPPLPLPAEREAIKKEYLSKMNI